MDTLIALIPALPLAGFLFAVLLGPRLDRVPLHGTHGPEGPPGDADHGHADVGSHAPPAEDLEPIPSEEQQARTSPHAGHADDLANADGADGVIPPELNDGLGQSGHVAAGAEQ